MSSTIVNARKNNPLEQARAEFEAARQAGYGDDDMAGLVRPYEQAAGVEIGRS